MKKYKVIAFIDGFNLYHTLRNNKDKWLDLEKLISFFIGSKEELVKICYFSAIANFYTGERKTKPKRHKVYMKALRSKNVEISLGKFKRKQKFCYAHKQFCTTHEEKQTDINIALKMFEYAMKDLYDKALLISGDSDFIPVISSVKENFDNKKIKILLPPNSRAKEIINASDEHAKIKDHHIKSSRLEDEIILKNGEKIYCPKEWK